MTEIEWLNCWHPQAMLHVLRSRGKLSQRKARLFAVACCHPHTDQLYDQRSRRALEIAERHAEGQATNEMLEAARRAAEAASIGYDVPYPDGALYEAAASTVVDDAVWAAFDVIPHVLAAAAAGCVSKYLDTGRGQRQLW